MIDLQHLRTLCDAATPGPWMRVGLFVLDDQGWWLDTRGDNTAFITAAREAVPALLDEVERLRAALRAMLSHSCVADAGADMKDDEDRAAERMAREALGERE